MAFKRSGSNLTPTSSLSNYGGSVNPIVRMLFMGMTMKAWLNYSKRVAEKMKAAEENGFDYIPSESEENEYEEYRSSSESEESSPSIEEDYQEKKSLNKNNDDDEHISEEDSEEAESKDLGSDDEKPSYQRRTSSKIDLLGSRLSRQSRDDYKFVIS